MGSTWKRAVDMIKLGVFILFLSGFLLGMAIAVVLLLKIMTVKTLLLLACGFVVGALLCFAFIMHTFGGMRW